MTQLTKALFVCLAILLISVFSAATYGQNPVYVSGGPYIYNVTNGGLVLVYDASIAVPTTGSAYTGPYFTSIAIGPDNADLDAHGNAANPFVIYACDTNHNTIIRFVPVSDTTTPPYDTVYNGSVEGFTPVCGRFSSTGDFYVTNQKAASTGVTVYKFAGVANVKMGSLLASTPTTVSLSGLGSNAASAGITTKNTGDLLLVDNANNAVLRAPFGTSTNPFSTVSTYISGGSLHTPTGIAKLSTGEILVANTQGSSPAISDFDRTGSTAGATCPGGINFPAGLGADANTSISFLASSETDVVYAATSQPPSNADFQEDLDFQPEGDNPGQVWMWTPGQGCALASVTLSTTQLFGAAVAPIPTNTVTETLSATVASPTATTFNFNSNAFQITAGGGCQAQVTAVPVDIATVEEAIILAKNNGLPNGGTPLVNLGENGYDIAYVAKWPSSGTCQSVLSGGGYANAIFGLYDSTLAVNPRILRCDSSPLDSPDEPLLDGTNTCTVLTTVGSYPLGGLIPQDTGVVGTGRGNSAFYLVNANFANGSSTTPTAIFCGFLPPLKNTSNPANASNFDGDDIIPVTFQLAKAGGNCKTGPFDNTAQALLSIAQLTPTFNYIFPLKTLPANGMFQPLGFAGLYSILLPVHANNFGLGEFSLSVLFQSGDAAQQSIVFNIVPEASIPSGQ